MLDHTRRLALDPVLQAPFSVVAGPPTGDHQMPLWTMFLAILAALACFALSCAGSALGRR